MEQPIQRNPRRRPRKQSFIEKIQQKIKTLNSKQLLIAGCVVGAVALIVAACIFLLGGDSPAAADPERTQIKELTVGSMERDAETMVVQTSYMPVEFPYAFSDLIQVQAVNQDKQAALEFSARIDGKDRKIYTIWFNADVGDYVGWFDLQDGEKPVQVTVVFYEPDAELQGDHRITYYATQETVNDVLTSMEKDENFLKQT